MRRAKGDASGTDRGISWRDIDGQNHDYAFDDYMRVVADARYIFRTAQRLADDSARAHSVDPLEHQAMIQVYGAAEQKLAVGKLAQRLDIVPALASRLVQQLQSRGLVLRSRSSVDRRATYVSLTKKGLQTLRRVVENAHMEIGYFRQKATEEQRNATHEIAALYVGSIERRKAGATPPKSNTVLDISLRRGRAG
jgi:DNA-binding MarR family transcriptional regulator